MLKIRPKPDEVPINDIIKWAINGELGLPEFQRKFAWSKRDIEELLVSILKGYFIGSFLFLRVYPKKLPFASRPLQGTERFLRVSSNNNFQKLILDGQQRITSLIYALYAPEKELITPKYVSKRYLFFLNLNELEKDNVDGAVFSYSDDDRRAKKYLDKKSQFEEKIIPFTILKSKDEWTEWIDEFKDYQRRKIFNELREKGINDNVDEFNNRLVDLDRRVKKWNEYINNLFNYPASVVYLPEISPDDVEGLEQITLVFEKINTTGVSLSVFDLLNARLYLKGIRLHKLWEDSVLKYEYLERLSKDNVDLAKILVLRTIGLLRLLRANFDAGKSEIGDIKNRSLINLSSNKFVEDFNMAVEYINKAVERIMSPNVNGFGAFKVRWIPYKAMIPVFATFLYYIENELSYSDKFFANKILEKWYWASVFGERYSGSPENTSLEDFKELISSVNNRDMPELIKKASIYVREGLNLLKVYSSSSAIYKGIINLIVLNGARDFLFGDNITFHNLEDHHIFPKAYLQNEFKLEDKELINTILNRTLISRKTNNHIKYKAPGEYLKEIESSTDSLEVLEPHFITNECIYHMRNNNYYEFLKCRERAIKYRILQLLEVKIQN